MVFNTIFVKKSFKISTLKIKNIVKLEIIVLVRVKTSPAHTCNLKYNVPKEILIVFHNGFNWHYHFIIKELAKEFEGQFICLGKNTEK